jgi:hypothetical protein
MNQINIPWYMFLAEEISEGTFLRINFQNVIADDQVKVKKFPYIIITNLVFLASNPAGFSNFEGIFRIKFDGEVALEAELVSESNRNTLLIVLPIRAWLFAPSAITCEFEFGGHTFSKTWQIDQGDSPYHGPDTPMRQSTIVTATSREVDVPRLVSMATEELVIVDAYLSPEDLAALLPSLPSGCKLQVPVPPKQKAAYQREKSNLQALCPTLELKVFDSPLQTGPFHDRFLLINKTELYWFGTSFKSVLSGRVCRTAKIFAGHEFDEAKKALDGEWLRATPL